MTDDELFWEVVEPLRSVEYTPPSLAVWMFALPLGTVMWIGGLTLILLHFI